METLMLRVLHECGLPSPVPQFEITDAQGHFVGRVDAALPQWRIAIEYDSKQEHSDEFQLARDARRRNQIVAAGWLPLTARHQDLARGGSELCATISAAIQHNRRRVTPDSVVT
jgi:very-short-patch-repair endonuclease